MLASLGLGGVETWLMHMFRQAEHFSIEHEVLLTKELPGEYEAEARRLGIRIHKLPMTSSKAAWLRSFRRLLEQEGPFEAVHSHVYLFSAAVLEAAKTAKVPLRIAHCHTARSRGSDHQTVRNRLRRAVAIRWFKRTSTRRIGISDAAIEEISGPGWRSDPKSSVLLYGFDFDRYRGAGERARLLRTKLGIAEDAPVIGHVGRFEPVKNHAFLLKAFTDVLERVPAAQLVCVGDGPTRTDIVEQAAALGIGDRVHLVGTSDDVPAYMAMFDAFVLPSFSEGLGIVCVEAQAAGTPLIVSDAVPREVEVVAGSTEFLSLDLGPAHWAGEIVRSLAQPGADRGDWLRQVEKSRFAIGRCVADLDRVYRPGPPPVVFVLVQTGAAANGGVSSVSQIIAGLRHHRPVIITDHETDRVKDWRRQGIETYVVPTARGVYRHLPKVMLSYWRYFRAVRQVLESTGAKVLHANDALSFQLCVAPARSAGVAIALNLRDTINPGRPRPKKRYRFLFGIADHVFYLSKNMAERWKEVAPNAAGACSVTYSIVDPDRFAAKPASRSEHPVVLISGLVGSKKGQLDYIRKVAPKLAAAGISTWLAGDFDSATNPYMAECARAAAPLGDAVRFLGYSPDVPQLMERATVIAVTSRHEGLVRAMIEAMSCARPVVSFDVCSAREILEEQSGGAGTVVHMGDYEGLANAILAYCRDPELAAQAGEKGRSTALRLFAKDTVVARYEDVYDRLTTALK